MIRGDPPDGWPGALGDGAGRAAAGEDGNGRAAVDATLCPPAPAAAAWHPATATATTAKAARRRRPCCAMPSQRDPDRLIPTSSSTMATADAPPAARPEITTSRAERCMVRPSTTSSSKPSRCVRRVRFLPQKRAGVPPEAIRLAKSGNGKQYVIPSVDGPGLAPGLEQDFGLCAPGRDRTCDPLLRRQPLYPLSYRRSLHIVPDLGYAPVTISRPTGRLPRAWAAGTSDRHRRRQYRARAGRSRRA